MIVQLSERSLRAFFVEDVHSKYSSRSKPLLISK